MVGTSSLLLEVLGYQLWATEPIFIKQFLHVQQDKTSFSIFVAINVEGQVLGFPTGYPINQDNSLWIINHSTRFRWCFPWANWVYQFGESSGQATSFSDSSPLSSSSVLCAKSRRSWGRSLGVRASARPRVREVLHKPCIHRSIYLAI